MPAVLLEEDFLEGRHVLLGVNVGVVHNVEEMPQTTVGQRAEG